MLRLALGLTDNVYHTLYLCCSTNAIYNRRSTTPSHTLGDAGLGRMALIPNYSNSCARSALPTGGTPSLAGFAKTRVECALPTLISYDTDTLT